MVDAGNGHRRPFFIALAAVLAVRCIAAEQCMSKITDGPMIITAACTDPLYNSPIIDLETDRSDPVPHRVVSGHWNGTSVDFNIYLPPHNQWENRFFQSVYPTQNSTALPEVIAFGAASGAYTVHVAGRLGYRADAATAKFAKTVAEKYYNDTESRRIYGYIYGGSGGSYQAIGAAENTLGVWDGASAIVQAIPGSVPLNLCARALGNLILRRNASQIEAALRPGGSGDPFFGLSQAGRAVLKEVTNLGVPLQAWEYFLEPAGSENVLAIFEPDIKQADPAYAEDFWTKPGYLGTEPSEVGSLFRAALVDIFATIQRVEYDAENLPTALFLDKIPLELTAGFEFTLYDDTGRTVIGNLGGVLSSEDNSLALSPISNATIARAISQGRKLRIDNRWHLSIITYYRHQLPTRSGFYGYDQFRTMEGEPIYPQRAVRTVDRVAISTSGGGTHTGNITMKVIVVDNLLDSDAFPWHADWYMNQVRQTLGNKFDDMYRLWYNERSDHYAEPLNKTRSIRLVPYNGVYEHALRDLHSWVENEVPASASTHYVVEESQIKAALDASQRLGVQPTVSLSANCSIVQNGSSIVLQGSASVPPGTSKIIAIEWDYLGTGDFSPHGIAEPSKYVEFKTTHHYSERGQYYPSVRVTAQREDARNTKFCLVYNLARTSVTVL